MIQDFIEILILSAVQGISEFLPISSSAHLILISNFYNFSSSSLFIDIGLHLGSLFAIIYYFKQDLLNLKDNQKLLVLILVGSIPLIIFGKITLFYADALESEIVYNKFIGEFAKGNFNSIDILTGFITWEQVRRVFNPIFYFFFAL